MRPKQAREAFLFLDRDRSGRLTLREVNEAVTAVFQCALPLTLHPRYLPPCTFRAGRIAWPEPLLHQAAHSSALISAFEHQQSHLFMRELAIRPGCVWRTSSTCGLR